MMRSRSFLVGLLVGAALAWRLTSWHRDAAERERAQAAWSLYLVVESHPDHAAMWRAWRVEFEAARERSTP